MLFCWVVWCFFRFVVAAEGFFAAFDHFVSWLSFGGVAAIPCCAGNLATPPARSGVLSFPPSYRFPPFVTCYVLALLYERRNGFVFRTATVFGLVVYGSF